MGDVINLGQKRQEKKAKDFSDAYDNYLKEREELMEADTFITSTPKEVNAMFDKAEARYLAHKKRMAEERAKHNKGVTKDYHLKKDK